MGSIKNLMPRSLRIGSAQQALRKTKGKSDTEIQAAVNEAVREGSPVELTSRTLQRMRLSEEKIAQFMRAGYPYPSPPA